ncbi:MAG: MFS transporter [Pseudomonadota bacterium]
MLREIRPVAGLLISTFFLLIGSGLTGILLPLRAGIEGWSPSTIGFMGSFYAACFLAGCVLMPRLVRRVGHVRVYAVVATLLSISLMGHAVFVNVPSWFLFRGVAGFAIAGAYMVIESWLNERTSNETRGSVFSAYMVTNTVGLMVGQFLLITADPVLTTLFIFAAMAYAAAVIPTGMTAAISPQPPAEVKIDIRKLYNISPVATVGAMASGFTFGAWNFQAPVYGAQLGLSTGQIATMLIVAMIGGVTLQFPLGRTSDRMDRRLVMLASTGFGLVVAVILVLLQPTEAIILFTLMFLFGGILMPLYSLVVSHANDHAASGEFVEISSGLLIVFGVGSMVGPIIAGLLMDIVGRNGLFWTMIIGYAAFAGFTSYRLTQRQALSEEERGDFAYSPIGRSQTPEVWQLDPRSDEESE